MPRVVITDSTFAGQDIEKAVLEPAGCEVVYRPYQSEAELIELIREADGVITQFAKLTPAVIAAMKQTKVIVRNGIGYDNIDVEAARERNIPVCNIPDYCIDEVADHTLAMILALTRQVLPNALVVRNGQWKLAVLESQMRTLRQTVVGIVGFGRIGRMVVQRLRAFGGRILVFDPYVPAEAIKAGGAEPTTLDDLWAGVDLVSLHCLLNKQTRHLVNAASFGRMKRGVLFVNIGRGGLVDTDALIVALRSGQVAGAALDVLETEPMAANSPLRSMDNVLVHSHIASVSVRAMQVARETSAQIVVKALRGEELPNLVNGVASRGAGGSPA
jgi:D-3-phosphoglycerate dehydrogenase